MSIVALTGKDTIQLNGRILTEFADQKVAELTYPNDLATMKTGKNGNTIYAFNSTGRQCDVTLRLVRGGADDQFLNALLLSFVGNPAGFTLMVGEFIKNIGDGLGNIKTDSYILSGGTFKKQTDVFESTEADIEQAVAVYHLMFSNSPRSIG